MSDMDMCVVRLRSGLGAELTGFHPSKCVCLHWISVQRVSALSQSWRSGALLRKYTELFLPDVRAQCINGAHNRSHWTGNRAQKQNKGSGLFSK